MSKPVARNDSDNFSTNSGTISLNDNSLNDESQTSLASSIASTSNDVQSNGATNNNKYEKLIQDYVKLRSKLSIVKKAYIELSESSAQKDQSLRKYEQEVEGLNFRNQQLTSRVETLQRDLDAHQLNSSGTSSSNHLKLSPSGSNIISPVSTNSLNHHYQQQIPSNSLTTTAAATNSDSLVQHNKGQIIAEELEHKINENTQLHRRLNEVEVEFRQKLSKTEQSLKQIEYDKILLEKKLESLETTSKITIERLQNDKIRLELNLVQLENQLRETHHEKEMKESELAKKETELIRQVEQNEQLNKNSSSSSLSSIQNNSLVRSFNEDGVLASCVKSSIEALCRVYSCLEERNGYLKSFLTNGPPLKLALKCEQSLNSLDSRYKARKFGEMSVLLDEYFEYNQKLLQSMVSELSVSTSVSLAQISPTIARPSEDMDKLNKKIKLYLNKINVFLFDSNQVDEPCFSKLLSQLFAYFVSPTPPLHSTFRQKFTTSVKLFVDLLDKFLFAFNEKLSLEYNLEYTSSVTTVDECLVSYFSQLKQSLSQIGTLVENTNLIEIIDTIRLEMKEDNNTTSIVANSQEQSLNESRYLADIESLKEQLEKKELELIEISDKYEQLKQKYDEDSRQTNDLKLRLEKLQAQYLELEEKQKLDEQELRSLRLNLNANSNNKVMELAKVQPTTSASRSDQVVEEDHGGAKENEDLFSKDIVLENEIIEAYMKQIETLNSRIQYLDSKTVYYYDEVKSLLERLKLQLDANKIQDGELNEIKDQLDRTRSSYEMQMSTMSDHLIEMTDRMSRQAEDNEKLKHELMSVTSAQNSNSNKTLNSKTNKKSK